MKRLFILSLLFIATCAPIRPSVKPDLAPEPRTIPKITLTGSIDADSVAAARAGLQELAREGSQTIVFEINSGGGEVEEGFKLVKEIEEYPGRVICVVDGEGMSMAFYLLQSCHTRYMTKRSVLMIHQPRFQRHGPPPDAIDAANLNGYQRALSQAMVEHMAGRMGMAPDAMLDKIPSRLGWWLNWEEALCVNAVDAVVPSVGFVVDSLKDGELPVGLRCNPK